MNNLETGDGEDAQIEIDIKKLDLNNCMEV